MCHERYKAGEPEGRAESQQPRRRQLRRLSEAEIEEMVEAYQSGKTVYQSAEVFGIARQTVGIILQRQGFPTRNSVPSAARAGVARLRGEGWSLAKLANKWGVSGTAIRTALAKHAEDARGR
jgi:DNA-directed RNA polymerase specialized sigma24 family protein